MIATVFALEFESAGFRAMQSSRLRISVWTLGVAGWRSAEALRRMIENSRPEIVVSAGFSGALQPELKLGEIVIGENFSAPRVLRSIPSLQHFRTGQILTVPDILADSDAKRKLGASSGALAGDLESAHLHQVCLDAGMDDYLTKPIKPALLLQLLNKFCDHPMESVAAATADTPAATAAKTPPDEGDKSGVVFSQSELLERLGGRGEMIPRFVGLFCKGVVPEFEGLATSLAAGDADGVRRHAHAIKGSSGNIAAQRMHQTAALMEKAAKEGDLTEAPEWLARLQQEYREFAAVVGVEV